MIDFEGVDAPVSVHEGGGVVLHEGLAIRCFGGAGTIAAPDIARPVAAEGRVEDDLLVLEIMVDVAAALEFRDGVSPAGGIRVAAGDVGWDAAAREEPDADGVAGPFCRVDTTAGRVEAGAVGGGGRGGDSTSSVCGLPGGIDVAVRSRHGASVSAIVGNGAPGRGVQGHGVLGLGVDAFDDVDFAAVGPIRTYSPAMSSVRDGVNQRIFPRLLTRRAMSHKRRRACGRYQR